MRRPKTSVLPVVTSALPLPAAHAGPAAAAAGPPTAAVSLGDSFVSGEAGRWAGNSLSLSGSNKRTDRAWVGRRLGYHDLTRVYLDGTALDGCHRSDVADIHSAAAAGLAVDTTINLACSGAEARDVWRASSGGRWQNGRMPQADQLAEVAATHDVELIVLSIGGNDLGFADIIAACAQSWILSPSWWEDHCEPEQQRAVDRALPGAMEDVATAIAEIRAVMTAAGDEDYRFVLTTYPSPVPRGSQIRYRESGWSRLDTGGCPFWNEDATWARDELTPQLADALRGVADAAGVDVLDRQDLFEGREVCARGTSHSDGSPNSVEQEWVRWLELSGVQGQIQESMHPNAYGQQASGACIAAMASVTGSASCTNVPGQPASVVTLTPAG